MPLEDLVKLERLEQQDLQGQTVTLDPQGPAERRDYRAHLVALDHRASQVPRDNLVPKAESDQVERLVHLDQLDFLERLDLKGQAVLQDSVVLLDRLAILDQLELQVVKCPLTITCYHLLSFVIICCHLLSFVMLSVVIFL